jgi:cellulose synthase/poly-beta-1,6-N-acetylglucosamine synthase-like glycosyltransferase
LQHQQADGVRYEVLVVDNNSTARASAEAEQDAQERPGVRYLFEPRPGVSHARNRGIAAARAPIVAFIDDDVEATPTWIASIKRGFDTHSEIDCLGGRIDPRWAEPPPTWLTQRLWAAVALQAAKGESPYLDADHAAACLMTANFACRRRALDEVGGFATDYLRDEDRELQLRLWGAGKRGMYLDDVAVVTEVPPDRMTKAYHRQFYKRVGRSHARMRYLDRIEASGRLLTTIPPRVTVLGTPGYIYRNLFQHAAQLVATVLTLQWDRAFFHQTRVLYLASYIRARQQDEQWRIWSMPRDLFRLLTARLRRLAAVRVGQQPAVLPDQSART